MDQTGRLKTATGSYDLFVGLPGDLPERMEVGRTINPRQQKPIERRDLQPRKVCNRQPRGNGLEWVRRAHTKNRTRCWEGATHRYTAAL